MGTYSIFKPPCFFSTPSGYTNHPGPKSNIYLGCKWSHSSDSHSMAQKCFALVFNVHLLKLCIHTIQCALHLDAHIFLKAYYHQSPRSHLHWGRCLTEFLPVLLSLVSPRATSLWIPSAPQKWSVHHRRSQTESEELEGIWIWIKASA